VDPVLLTAPEADTHMLGHSTFRNIIDFYRFEYKPHEKAFWDILDPAVDGLPDKVLPLVMSKVAVGYPWLDYVTDVDIKYHVVYNKLIIHVPTIDDPHEQALALICNMMFVSDFQSVKDAYARVDISGAWQEILDRATHYQQSLLH
jgi:hypothetical protein